jgi:cold shock protein
MQIIKLYNTNREEMLSVSMTTGVVKWFNNEKGYGFISGNNGNDVFVHKTHIKDKTHELHEGESVLFDVVEDEKGPSAINVQKL